MAVGFVSIGTSVGRERRGRALVHGRRGVRLKTRVKADPKKEASVGDEEYWAELTRDLYGDLPETDSKKKGPEFVYPEGVDAKSMLRATSSEKSAWQMWSSAIEKEATGVTNSNRDAKKETDFWRDAAKDLISGKPVEFEAAPAAVSDSGDAPSDPTSEPPAAGGLFGGFLSRLKDSFTPESVASAAPVGSESPATRSNPWVQRKQMREQQRPIDLPVDAPAGDLADAPLEARSGGASAPFEPSTGATTSEDDLSYWGDIAREIGQAGAAPDPPPGSTGESSTGKWVYPDDVKREDFFSQTEEEISAWGTWNVAIERDLARDEFMEFRDPAREKDFWRGAAREIGGVATRGVVTMSAPSESSASDNSIPEVTASTGSAQSGGVPPTSTPGSTDATNTASGPPPPTSGSVPGGPSGGPPGPANPTPIELPKPSDGTGPRGPESIQTPLNWDLDTTSEDMLAVWIKARELVKETYALMDEMRDYVDSYDPVAEKGAYRRAAKELIWDLGTATPAPSELPVWDLPQTAEPLSPPGEGSMPGEEAGSEGALPTPAEETPKDPFSKADALLADLLSDLDARKVELDRMQKEPAPAEAPPSATELEEEAPPTTTELEEEAPPTTTVLEEEAPPTTAELEEEAPPTTAEVEEEAAPSGSADNTDDLLSDLEARKEALDQLQKQDAEEETTMGREVSLGEWDPDRDWRRFDDVGAELDRQRQVIEERAKYREELAASEEEASPSGADDSDKTVPDASDTVKFRDEAGRELTRQEVNRLKIEGAVFVDENGDVIDVGEDLIDSASGAAPSGPVTPAATPDAPTFGSETTLPRKRFSRSTYGGDRGGIEDDLKILQESGMDLRDPKADTDYWRGAARELADASPEAGAGADDAGAEVGAEVGSAPASPEDEASAWSSWSNAVTDWEKAVEEAPERDPKMEVDMWRDTARELQVGDEAPAEEAATSPAAAGPDEEASAWSSWNSASSDWQKSVEEAPMRDAKQEVDMWRDTARELQVGDEAPAEEAATSPAAAGPEEEASAWSSWNSASSDWQKSVEEAPTRDAKQEVDMWRDTAREIADPVPAEAAADSTPAEAVAATDSTPAEVETPADPTPAEVVEKVRLPKAPASTPAEVVAKVKLPKAADLTPAEVETPADPTPAEVVAAADPTPAEVVTAADPVQVPTPLPTPLPTPTLASPVAEPSELTRWYETIGPSLEGVPQDMTAQASPETAAKDPTPEELADSWNIWYGSVGPKPEDEPVAEQEPIAAAPAAPAPAPVVPTPARLDLTPSPSETEVSDPTKDLNAWLAATSGFQTPPGSGFTGEPFSPPEPEPTPAPTDDANSWSTYNLPPPPAPTPTPAPVDDASVWPAYNLPLPTADTSTPAPLESTPSIPAPAVPLPVVPAPTPALVEDTFAYVPPPVVPVPEVPAPTPEPAPEDEASVWSSWNTAAADWQQSMEAVDLSDAKQEVDMWRGAAKQMTNGGPKVATAPVSRDWGSGLDDLGQETRPWSDWNIVTNAAPKVAPETEIPAPLIPEPEPEPEPEPVSEPIIADADAGADKAESDKLGASVDMWRSFAKSVQVDKTDG